MPFGECRVPRYAVNPFRNSLGDLDFRKSPRKQPDESYHQKLGSAGPTESGRACLAGGISREFPGFPTGFRKVM